MNSKIFAVGAVLAASLLAGLNPASASEIEYILSGTGSGVVNDGGVSTPFTDVPFTIDAFGDLSTYVDNPGVASALVVDAGQITLPSGTTALQIASDNHILVSQGADAGVVLFGEPPYPDPAAFYSLALVGYDPRTAIGPISVAYLGNLDTTLAGGADMEFDTIKDATFAAAAAAPEPASWLMMLMGVAGLGAVLRARRRAPEPA